MMSVKERALDRLFYGVQECVWAGATAAEIRNAIAEMYAQIHREEAKSGAEVIHEGRP